MPVTVVVGGQFGSEGKGKIAHWVARREGATAVVRIGGSNSGHTIITPEGERFVLRHLPTAALLPDISCIIGPGAYIDFEVLEREIQATGIERERVYIDPNASLITEHQKAREADRGCSWRIGSTLSGTGECVADRVRRGEGVVLARDDPRLDRYTRDGPVRTALRVRLARGERVVVEGTQGFGLSVLHAEEYPKATSRDTTAAAAIAEASLSPRDVDRVIMTLRAFPIRVPGDSGSLPKETTWERIARDGGWPEDALGEHTSVTDRLRRVAQFDPDVVRHAIEVNRPDVLVLNHLDYFDRAIRTQARFSERVLRFLQESEASIGQQIDWIGIGERALCKRSDLMLSSRGRLLA